MKLVTLALSVQSRDDFVVFLTALADDVDAHADQWENIDLRAFLLAAAAWCRDSDGYYTNSGQDPAQLTPWRLLADVLMAARTYE